MLEQHVDKLRVGYEQPSGKRLLCLPMGPALAVVSDLEHTLPFSFAI